MVQAPPNEDCLQKLTAAGEALEAADNALKGDDAAAALEIVTQALDAMG